jgi:hypothetical protein
MKAKTLTVKLSHDRFDREVERESLGSCWKKQLVSRFPLSPSVGSTTSARLILVFPFFVWDCLLNRRIRICAVDLLAENRDSAKETNEDLYFAFLFALEGFDDYRNRTGCAPRGKSHFRKVTGSRRNVRCDVHLPAGTDVAVLPERFAAGRPIPTISRAGGNEVKGGSFLWGCGDGGLVQLSSFSR